MNSFFSLTLHGTLRLVSLCYALTLCFTLQGLVDLLPRPYRERENERERARERWLCVCVSVCVCGATYVAYPFLPPSLPLSGMDGWGGMQKRNCERNCVRGEGEGEGEKLLRNITVV